ncbi:MAG: TonB-dependent receptor domain-containing protein, partial [Flavobacteriaceae bacterium]
MNKLSALWMLLLITTISWAQNPNSQTVTLKGRILEQSSDLPLEYATFVLQKSADQSMVTGGITDEQGRFQVDIPVGNYEVVFEFISYSTVRLSNQNITKNTDLGDVRMSADVSQLDEVELIAERSTVELRLDKKIYNVGKDMTVKGGSVTDVLDNVPSVSVDVEGGISLRGNESVRILINGKPSALSGFSNDALRLLPAEAIEKVEVITNPSSRYDAEGTAGIINIILRQNKTTGINGTTNLTLGDPKNEAGSLGLNLRQNKFNLFSNWTYRNQEGPGNSLYDQINYNDDGSIRGYQNEKRNNVRAGTNANANVGIEYFINPTMSITNSTVFGYSEGDNTTNIDFVNSNPQGLPLVNRVRNTLQLEQQRQFEYSLNVTKKFEKAGHELRVDYQYSESEGSDDSVIEETLISDTAADVPTEKTVNQEDQRRALYQFNYVLPLGSAGQSQFELGYRGGYVNQTTAFIAGSFDPLGTFINNANFSNTLEYREWIQAAYTQLGTKWERFNLLGGLRMEHTDIGINLLETQDLTTKKYINWFPSLFVGYSLNEEDQITLSYSKRLRRPWSRFINPFPSRSSNTNLFQGNPDLDPTFTDAYDLGMINQREKFTFNTSLYYNRSTGVFQFITQETGELIAI